LFSAVCKGTPLFLCPFGKFFHFPKVDKRQQLAWRAKNLTFDKIFRFMASISIKVSAEELDEVFLKNLRALFKSSQLKITFESDNTAALAQLSGMLASRQREGAAYSVPGEAFDALLDRAETEEGFDVISALKAYKK